VIRLPELGVGTLVCGAISRLLQEMVVRGRSAQVCETNGRMVVEGEDMLTDRAVELPADLVILAMEANPFHVR
jgi:heterodisulfide reductase subunit A-like polyferredoxin